jgi:hypothetical protein
VKAEKIILLQLYVKELLIHLGACKHMKKPFHLLSKAIEDKKNGQTNHTEGAATDLSSNLFFKSRKSFKDL